MPRPDSWRVIDFSRTDALLWRGGRGGENHDLPLMAGPLSSLCEVSHTRPMPGIVAALRPSGRGGVTIFTNRRPSLGFHSYILANLRLVLAVDVRAGNAHTSKHAAPELRRLLNSFAPHAKPAVSWPIRTIMARPSPAGRCACVPLAGKQTTPPGVAMTRSRRRHDHDPVMGARGNQRPRGFAGLHREG